MAYETSVSGVQACDVSLARGNKKPKAGAIEQLHALIDQMFAAVMKLRSRWWCIEDEADGGPGGQV